MAPTNGYAKSPSPTGNTPTLDTATLTEIRTWTQARAGWWQFELRPWHYWTAITAVFACAAAVTAVLITHGGIR